MAALDTFIALRDYVKGKIDDYDLRESDELISQVRENSQNRGQSIIYLGFDNEETLLRSIGLSDDDVWFYRVITSPYSDYEFYDYYTIKQDFEEGYGVYYVLDDENIEKLKQIGKLLLPIKVDLEDSDYRIKLSEKLLTNFKGETEDILHDYASEKNYEMRSSAEENITKDLNDFLEKFGMEIYGDDIKTTVANLIMLYIKENSIHLSLTELFEKLFGSDYSIGGWLDNEYEYHDSKKFDSKSFNSYVGGKLDEILEKIEDSENLDGVTIQDYTEMTDRILKKFELEKYYNLPKDLKKETRFKIEGFEYPNMKVVVNLQKGLKQKKIKVSEENFYNLLYQPSLFDLEEI